MPCTAGHNRQHQTLRWPRFLTAAAHDAGLFRAFPECQAGLATLTEILARPALLDRAQQLAGDVPPIPAPGRHQLLQIIG
jgi:hypothetical protein